MIRRTLVSCAAGALALFFILMPTTPQAQGQQGGPIAALQTRVQTLEEAVADLSAALDALSTQEGTLSTDLQTHIANASAQLIRFQQLLNQFNQALSTAETDIATLEGQFAALQDEVAALGGGLTTYDQLADLPCTTALGTAANVTLVGWLKTPICGRMSANGRFIDFTSVVVDTQTNVVWEKKTTAVGSGQNVADLHDVDNTYTWCQAILNSAWVGVCNSFTSGNGTGWIDQVNAEVFAGSNSWRVPTRDELLTILDTSVTTCGSGTPCIDPIFGPTQASIYWSSTQFGSDTALFVNFFNGNPINSFGSKGNEFHVRAVRDGQRP